LRALVQVALAHDVADTLEFLAGVPVDTRVPDQYWLFPRLLQKPTGQVLVQSGT
jgi:hypothetical protein